MRPISDLFSQDINKRYLSLSDALKTSQQSPELLYSHFDRFEELLESKNNIMKWTALQILGNLASVDTDHRIDSILPKIIANLNEGKMTTANNAISALATIAGQRSDLREKICLELLQVENYKYDTNECRNIAIGKVVLSFELLKDCLSSKIREELLQFLTRQSDNSRSATAKKAQSLLKTLKA